MFSGNEILQFKFSQLSTHSSVIVQSVKVQSCNVQSVNVQSAIVQSVKIQSFIVQSCYVNPCEVVRQCPVVQYPVLQFQRSHSHNGNLATITTIRGFGADALYTVYVLHHIRTVDTVFQAIILQRLAYALPAWGPFLSVVLKHKIDGFLKRSFRYGFTKEIFHIQTIIDSVTYDLFNKVKASNHCLYHLLPPQRPLHDALRVRGHQF